MESTVERIFNTLRTRIPGVTALVLISADGGLIAHASMGFHLDAETFAAEHATLLRIVQRTAEDTGIGRVEEHILVSNAAIVIARHLPSNQFAIVVCNIQGQLGRLRYELKCAARDLQHGL